MIECREWNGPVTSAGYGRLRRDGRKWYVHRLVMALVHGEASIEGKVVMHSCDNPRCFRYDHLSVGTHADNSADMVSKGRQHNHHRGKTHCAHGHEFTPENTMIVKGGRACR